MSALAVEDGTDPVWSITEEVFTAMVDREPGHLLPAAAPSPGFADPLHAWVDVHGSFRARVLLVTEAPTAGEIARALLDMPDDEPVTTGDVADALGEVANVVGGNVKSLVPDTDGLRLSLPEVSAQAPDTDGLRLVHELALEWRGRGLVLRLAHADGS